jgi:P-type E1-E2 ATPase
LVEEYPSEDQDATLSILLGLVSGIKHPVATAVSRHLQAQNITASQVEDIQTVTSQGIQGALGGQIIRAGNSRWLKVESHPQVSNILSKGYTVFCVEIGGALSAIFGLQDTLRPDAQSTISELIKRNIEVSIVSGDDEAAVQAIGTQLGVPAANIKARCNPGDKKEYLKSLAASKPKSKAKSPTTLFIGDGTNDAVALAQASIGVHMNEGTDLAQSAADVVLMRSALSGILLLMDLSKASMRRVAFNFFWSFLYNVFAIALAAGAFVRVRIPPEFAGLGELVSVLPVILIAILLKWVKFEG